MYDESVPQEHDSTISVDLYHRGGAAFRLVFSIGLFLLFGGLAFLYPTSDSPWIYWVMLVAVGFQILFNVRNMVSGPRRLYIRENGLEIVFPSESSYSMADEIGRVKTTRFKSNGKPRGVVIFRDTAGHRRNFSFNLNKHEQHAAFAWFEEVKKKQSEHADLS